MASFKSNTFIQEAKDLSKYGKEFQAKLLHLLIKDRPFSFSILPIVKDIYFSDIYFRTIFSCLKAYVSEFYTTPSFDNLKIELAKRGESTSTYDKILKQISDIDLEDRDYVITNTRAFCFTKYALAENDKIVNALKDGQFEVAKKLSIESFKHSGLETAKILDLKKDIEQVQKVQTLRAPLPTMFQTFNNNSKGGISNGEVCIVVAPSNFGKCFEKGTKVRMFDLSLKNIEDIKVGEKVLGPDGNYRTIQTTVSGFEEMFEIKQKNGISYTVNKSHILALKRKSYSKVNYTSKKEITKHKHLENEKDFINIKLSDYISRSNNWKRNVNGYKSGFLEFEDRNITIDPYYLGLWLGDGSHECTQISNIDEEVITFLGEYCNIEKLRLTNYGATKIKKGIGWGLVNEAGLPNPLKEKLKNFNLIGNKHIPENYLFSSKETRLKLLAGLLDSDGYLDQVTGTNFEIAQKRKDLAWQIYILCSSLGFKTKYKESKNGKYGCVKIAGDTYLIPTKIKRKQANKRKKTYDPTLCEIEVVEKGIGEYFGFSLLEEDKRFLLEDFTVVHNSQWLVAQARHLNFIGKNVAFFSYEMEAEPLVEKYMAGLLDVNQDDVFRIYKKDVNEYLKTHKLGELKFITDKASNATLAAIQNQIEYLKSTGFFPDAIIIDGLNQLKLPKDIRAKDDNEKYELLTEGLKDMCKDVSLPAWACWQTNRCLSVNELVDIENKGKQKIKNIKEGDKILTHKGYKKVTKIYGIEKQPCYKIKLKNGKEIIVSAKHEFPVEIGLKSIETGLKVGDKLFCKKE